MRLTSFAEVADRYLRELQYEPYHCENESEARARSTELINSGKWPCYFFESDTTGEKGFEEFFTSEEVLDMNRFHAVGVISNDGSFDDKVLNQFLSAIEHLGAQRTWEKSEIVAVFKDVLPNFEHKETGRHLDNRM